jgi:hypothetical protein
MPSYAWKLNDQQVAAVTTYIRNSWGNAAEPVSAHDVAKMRKQLSFGPGPAGHEAHGSLNRPNPMTWAPANTLSSQNGTAQAAQAAPASAGSGRRSGGQNGSTSGHPAGVTAGGPG